MFYAFVDRWEKIPGIYPMYIFTVILLLSYFNKWEGMFMITFILIGLHLPFWLWQASRNYSRKMNALGEEPEDDPAGNSNITKKFYDNM